MIRLPLPTVPELLAALAAALIIAGFLLVLFGIWLAVTP